MQDRSTNSLQESIPVLLDTDIGSDIDDAVALSYLLRQHRCELLGITTVAGEAGKRASIADALCRMAGRTDIPIHAGIERPLLVTQRQPVAEQYEALDERWPHRAFDGDGDAVSFLRDTIRARPNEITLLAIGPLTNIALLFAAYPDIPGKLRHLVIMGGHFFPDEANRSRAQEWNMLCDPHAAAIVFAATLAQVTVMGLDVTDQCVLAADDARRRFAEAGGPLEPVVHMAEVWFRKIPKVTFHDPLAAAVIFEPTLCGTRLGSIHVELTGEGEQGYTFLQPSDGRAPHAVADSVDSEAFFAHYFGVVTAHRPRDTFNALPGLAVQ